MIDFWVSIMFEFWTLFESELWKNRNLKKKNIKTGKYKKRRNLAPGLYPLLPVGPIWQFAPRAAQLPWRMHTHWPVGHFGQAHTPAFPPRPPMRFFGSLPCGPRAVSLFAQPTTRACVPLLRGSIMSAFSSPLWPWPGVSDSCASRVINAR
jgi:hypothetical protein